ncbi:MAG: STAS domain-containing protein [Gammaproteobacteria bacterium]
MDIFEERHDGMVILAPQGRIDSNTSTGLERKLLEVLEQKPRGIVIDFAAIDYISSAGLRVVLMAAKRLRGSSAALALCQLNGFILRYSR